jgi:pimeloyl-ACP methyl ester carboxylesterase
MTNIWKTPAGREAVHARYAQFLQYWPQPAENLRLPTSQGETFVIAHGKADGPAVLMLHGSASNALVWARDATALGRYARVFAIDVIGEPGFSAESRPPLASGAYVQWLDEVMVGLGLPRAAIVGISLGGWLALEYAANRAEKVSALVLLCPGGVGKHRNVLLWAAPLMLLGPWGRKILMRRVGGPQAGGEASPAVQAFVAFNALIHQHFKVRRERLPRFGDAALRRLKMPVLTILGGQDVFIDSPGTRERMARHVPHGEVMYLPDAGHFLMGHTGDIDAFLQKALNP